MAGKKAKQAQHRRSQAEAAEIEQLERLIEEVLQSTKLTLAATYVSFDDLIALPRHIR